MLHGENKGAFRLEPAGDIPADCLEIRRVMEGQGAEDNVEGSLGKQDILHGHAAVLDNAFVSHGSGFGDHLCGNVYAQHGGRPVLRRISAVPAESASQVQNVLVMEIRQQPFQCFPFSGPFQPLHGTVHLAVLPEKGVIVVLVLFHDGEEMNVAWK